MGKAIPLVAGAGTCCIDYIMTAPQAQSGETAPISEYVVQGGGLIGTAMVACARLGAQCNLLTLLGDDVVGDQILTELEGEGISAEHAAITPGGKSPFSIIHVDPRTGERTIFHRSGSGLTFDPNTIDSNTAYQWDALLVDDIFLELSIRAARAAREQGVPVVADLIPSERNEHLLKLVDVLIAPRHYAVQLGCADDPAAVLEAMRRLGPGTAVITLGDKGCVYSDVHGQGSCEAFQVDVVDTTGAGDAFHGAYTYALARGWTTAACCEFASAVAAIKCTKPGGRTGLPGLPEVLEFLTNRRDPSWLRHAACPSS